jgi:cellulose synthase/poly-beta-1,6-N-acetylglucosamine synthase-like glycosyltransferase
LIAVIVPVHDEEAHLDACLRAIHVAARHPGLHGESVVVAAALDACSDGSERIAAAHPVQIVRLVAQCVGLARAAGAERALRWGARWLAFTDADSVVAPDWLTMQLEAGADVVCGTVEVADWSLQPAHVRERYDAEYIDAEGHPHVHGANLGISADAYRGVGGFRALALHEDVQLVASLAEAGWRIARTARARVASSAREVNRVAGGFAGYLAALAV